MEIALELPGFHGRDVKVRAGGILGRPQLLIDGRPLRGAGGRFRIHGPDGRAVEIRLLRRGDDPFPDVLLDGEKLPDLVPPFAWYHDLWVWLPFPLLCWFGLAGAFLGAVAVTVNATLFRWARSTRTAYLVTACSTAAVTLAGFVLTREPGELVAAWMTWIVVFG